MIKATVVSMVLILGPSLVIGSEGGFYVGANVGYGSIDDVADTSHGFEFGQSFIGPVPIPDLVVAGIDGIEFDDENFRWGLLVGYRFNRYIGAEISYTDLGSFESVVSKGSANSGIADLGISEFGFGAKLGYPITDKLYPNIYLGVSRANFDITGNTDILVAVGGVPPIAIFPIIEPYVKPGDETGYVWGIGFDWKVSERFTFDIGFKHHETQVLPIDTLILSVVFWL